MPKRFITVHTIRVSGLRPDPDLGGLPAAQPAPRLAWIVSGPPGWHPVAAELELTREPGSTEVAVLDGDGVDMAWPFAPLSSGDRAVLRIRARGSEGEASAWSDPAAIIAVFRHGSDGAAAWDAPFIAGADDDRPVRLRTEFAVSTRVRRAMLRLSAFGAVRAEVDGTPVGTGVLAPGWTTYPRRVLFDAHEVTALLGPGRHALGLEVAGAWFTESYGFGDAHRQVYGAAPAASAELELHLEDGSVACVRTGGDWRASTDGPLRRSGIYAGEDHDRRLVQPGWSRSGFDDAAWSPARVVRQHVTPTPRTGPAVRRLEARPVQGILTTPSGRTLLDFGQNLVGRIRLTAHGPAGARVTLRHAEVLDGGEPAYRPLRRAAATDTLVLGGHGAEHWEPEFTFHGFRYVEIETDGARVDAADVAAIVIGSDLERTGEFSCSDPLLNRLHENVVWSARGNFLGIPTDCPQRDERLGWTGDVQVFAPTASFLFDVEAFLGSWLDDVALEQERFDGVVPVVVPWVLDWDVAAVAGWGDAVTVVPTVLDERLGARSLLARHYPGMRSWCERLLERAGRRMLIEGGFQFGDWLDPHAPPHDPFAARTPADLVASAYLVRSLDLTARAARELGHDHDAARFARAARAARRAFARRFSTPTGRLAGDAPTAYALALGFDLFPARRRAELGARLAELVRRDGHRIGTGFLGTPLLLDALVDSGHAEDAFELLLQTATPSWLSPVRRGATTVWERWDSLLDDGTVNPGEMTSFNHYALGAVADFLHRRLAGLAPAAPGYRVLEIAPLVTHRLSHASARIRTPYGLAASSWQRDDRAVTVRATVPTGSHARVRLPDGRRLDAGPGTHEWTLEC